jgi:hypothetical protein
MKMSKDLKKRISIVLKNEDNVVVTNDKECEYFTAVGVAGELILYRITLHQMLSAKSEPTIWKVWSQYQWLSMEHDEV